MTARVKPFQQATVEAAVAALRGGNRTRRFLVADEVGLGKTVVARDTIAELATGARKFTVYYVTSGLKVADQNKSELLRFLGQKEAKAALSSVDRVGLMPFEPASRALRLYAFTPKTSFSGSQRLYGGKAVERAFIGCLLDERYPGLRSDFPRGFLEHGATSSWPWAVSEAKERIENVSQRFIDTYASALRAEFGFPVRDAVLAAVKKAKAGNVLGRLRKALARAALASMPPDLVVFDEFQCYRELLDPKADNPLARALLEGAEGGIPPPLLLLSATPYRFYAERWETEAGVQPHQEFFDIVEFLGGASVRTTAQKKFRRFGDLLHSIGRLPPEERTGPMAEAREIKRVLETILTPFMSRTERPVAMSVGDLQQETLMEPHDLDVYRHFAANVRDKFKGSAISYWLSVPLPAQSLGERYQISKGVKFPTSRSVPRLGVTNCFKTPKDGWGSAKLRALNALAPPAALALPWVAPSLAWWTPSGPWAKTESCPKMLIFSRFRATPQSVAALTSLEVERRFGGKTHLPYSDAWKKRHLNPKPNQGPTLALFHPSPFLILCVDPLRARANATFKQVRATVRQQIVRELPRTIAPKAPSARANRRRRPAWAVLAAIERAHARARPNDYEPVRKAWKNISSDDATLRLLLEQREDAESISWISSWELDALVDLAVGAPGNVVGRALLRHVPSLFQAGSKHYLHLVRFCWSSFRTYLDRPVFWSVLPGESATEKFQRACTDGCLEAALDEHFWLRKSKIEPSALIDDLASALAANVGTFAFKDVGEKDRLRIRCHAAVPFGATESETQRHERKADDPPPARAEEIRAAFNTPFWPHVLATTSVGQEGLDFHSWCDRLGHWDLCSSPVDLEQREGRIQRFGGLTVRRPLARALGKAALDEARELGSSPWDVIAREADKSFGDETGMSPWWTMPDAELKRHLFALPQSRDVRRFARLRSQRLLYRLAMGQPDQEDLVNLLASHDSDSARELRSLTLDLSAFSHRSPPQDQHFRRQPAASTGASVQRRER
ncbi:hypothetical protein ACVWXM_005391 [Bradyrhizobium sp. GM7.3]